MAQSRPSSILLQPYTLSSLNGLASSASSISSQTRDTVAAKRIRFAPLPQPDHQQPAIEACDDSLPPPSTEDVLASISSSSSSSSSSQLSSSTTSTLLINTQCDLDKYSPDSSVGSSPIIQLSPLPSKCSVTSPVIAPNSNSTTNNTATNSPVASQSLSWVKKPHFAFFKRFSTSSSSSSTHTLTPTPSIENPAKKRPISTEGNLSRTASRESTRSARDNNSGWGLGLTRWTSSGGNSTNLPGSYPLTRTQSTQSFKSKSSSLFPTFSSSSSSLSSESKTNPKPKQTPVGQQPRPSRHKGTRMLNGRVYGGPKKNPNPFANIRDEEPEFVEWGYGGMGSVKGAKSAGVSGNWDRLHGGSAMGSGDGTRTDMGAGAADADLDDGGGMAWLKKRKEERERKAREQKENEAEKENSESQTNTPVPTISSTLEPIPTLLPPSTVGSVTHTPPTIDVCPLTVVEEDGETATKANFPTPTPSYSEPASSSLQSPSLTEDQSISEEGGTSQLHNNTTTHENERVLQAITIPVRAPRPHHRHSSKVGSREVLNSPLTEGSAAIPQIHVVGSPILVSSSTSGDDDTIDTSIAPLHTSTIEIDKPTFPPSFSSSSSESGSESDADDGESDDDDDDDEEDEEDEEESRKQRRKTGTAAGVEKISRHKE
ncbi:hypothetical protein BYT27DRAFT_6500691 [Phlegmacium glaucopus]|nr:hypothetical protein BYT27DRAFT_6500691 [Phlegmacium glaucopus]